LEIFKNLDLNSLNQNPKTFFLTAAQNQFGLVSMAAQLLFFENSSLASPSARPTNPAFWPSSAHYTFPYSPGPKIMHRPS
jgi:hypothetical protein